MAKRATAAAADNEEVLDPAQPPLPGAVKVTSVETTTRRYVEPPTADAAEVVEDDDDWLPEDEALADFLDSAQNYMIRVEQISDAYASSGQTSLRTAPGTWCDDIPLTPDYRQIIRSAFGPGVYRLLLKENGKIRKHLILKIAAPAGAMATTSQPGLSHIRVMQGQQIDPIEMFRSQTVLVREFMKLSREMMPPAIDVPPSTNPELATQMAEQKGKLEMMQILLVHPNKDLGERLLTKLVGGDDGEANAGIWHEVLELGKELIKNGPELLRMLASNSAAQPDTTATAAPAPDSELRTPHSALPSPALPPDQRSPSQIAYARTIDLLTQGMYFDDMPGMAIAALDQLLTRYEEWQGEIDVMMSTDPVNVVSGLIANSRLADAPDETKQHWAAWIERLQAEYKAGEQQEPEPDADKS